MWEYCKPKSSFVPISTIPSSSLKVKRCFWNKLTLQFWSFALRVAPLPGTTTLMEVVFCSYPIPLSRTLIDVIVPFDNIGVMTAPIPSPDTTRSGGEIYFLPEFNTNTSWRRPLLIIGCNCAFSPVVGIAWGGLSKLRISEDPYPTPLLERFTEVISPLKIGWICAWKVSDPIEEIPIGPEIVTEISG